MAFDHRQRGTPAGSPQRAGERSIEAAGDRPGFADRLDQALERVRTPALVGLDPHLELLPEPFAEARTSGASRAARAAAIESFCKSLIEIAAGRVAAVKPQSAFFERFGSRGIAVLERAVADLRAAGGLVVMDAKRGDIGSTMAAYAETFLRPESPLFSDALTVSPYLGYGSLKPAVDLARESGAGLFVLALTSNPEGAEVQRAVREDGRTIGATMLAHLAEENAGESPMGSFGAVVGATDRYAGAVVSRPVSYQDVFATLYHNLGINPSTTTLTDPSGRPQHLLDKGEPIRELL